MIKLGVNIDHVATLRQARRAYEPSPLAAARLCIAGGCDSIVCHLREDRRHINDTDVAALRKSLDTRLNLEMSVSPEIVRIACRLKPDQATLVPERRQEITTEGGLDVMANRARVERVIEALTNRDIAVSLFVDPSKEQIDASIRAGARIIELHTGEYANAKTPAARKRHLTILKYATAYSVNMGLEVNAGHGLTYTNVKPVARIIGINELNIGHSIISRSVFVGLKQAVEEMRRLVR